MWVFRRACMCGEGIGYERKLPEEKTTSLPRPKRFVIDRKQSTEAIEVGFLIWLSGPTDSSPAWKKRYADGNVLSLKNALIQARDEMLTTLVERLISSIQSRVGVVVIPDHGGNTKYWFVHQWFPNNTLLFMLLLSTILSVIIWINATAVKVKFRHIGGGIKPCYKW